MKTTLVKKTAIIFGFGVTALNAGFVMGFIAGEGVTRVFTVLGVVNMLWLSTLPLFPLAALIFLRVNTPDVRQVASGEKQQN
jgi:hypothetical protein